MKLLVISWNNRHIQAKNYEIQVRGVVPYDWIYSCIVILFKLVSQSYCNVFFSPLLSRLNSFSFFYWNIYSRVSPLLLINASLRIWRFDCNVRHNFPLFDAVVRLNISLSLDLDLSHSVCCSMWVYKTTWKLNSAPKYFSFN